MPKSYNKIIWCSIVACLLLGIGYYIGSTMTSIPYRHFLSDSSVVNQDDATTTYPFVKPITSVDTPNALSVGDFKNLDTQIQQAFASQPDGVLTRYSVYFRDLNSGFWFGINENDTYDPASMLKVTFAMAAYKEAEDQPGFLNQKATYTPELANLITLVPFTAASELTVNDSYTIQDLISKMIVDSDNGAKDILGNTVDKTIIDNTYLHLGLTVPPDAGGYLISPKQYAMFFRVLYNTTYLDSYDYSNQLLQLLANSDFKKGLVAGVPSGIEVAHKFGERVFSGDNNVIISMELHDCGIIYKPNSPYLLCIMTQGKDEDTLGTAIASASAAVYNNFNGSDK